MTTTIFSAQCASTEMTTIRDRGPSVDSVTAGFRSATITSPSCTCSRGPPSRDVRIRDIADYPVVPGSSSEIFNVPQRSHGRHDAIPTAAPQHLNPNSGRSPAPCASYFPENQAMEPDWETYTQKVRDLDGTSLFLCIWASDPSKPCNYVAKKQLVKRHVLATHLGYR